MINEYIVNVYYEISIMGQRKKKKKAQKKRCLNKQKWEVFGRRMNGKEFENMSEMNSMMAKEGGKLARR